MSMIKVLVVDDSAVIRQLVKEILERDPEIEVVAVASDAYFAQRKLDLHDPDVITLDIEMPGMDGISFLEKVMHSKPTPVVMLSSYTDRHATETFKALELGAVDFVTKPKTNIGEGIEALAQELILKVKAAAKANIRKTHPKLHTALEQGADEVSTPKSSAGTKAGNRVIVLGASTGGTVAISDLLSLLPKDSPGIAIVQHMPEQFTGAYADRINGLVALDVSEAQNGDRLRRGAVLIAPGGKHMLLQKDYRGYYVQVKDGPPVNRHKPSVDVLFRSAASSAGHEAIGIILTGMGSDGAKGMRELKDAGAFNIAQSKETCVVFGMPKVAIELGGVDKIAAIEQIPHLLAQQDRKAS